MTLLDIIKGKKRKGDPNYKPVKKIDVNGHLVSRLHRINDGNLRFNQLSEQYKHFPVDGVGFFIMPFQSKKVSATEYIKKNKDSIKYVIEKDASNPFHVYKREFVNGKDKLFRLNEAGVPRGKTGFEQTDIPDHRRVIVRITNKDLSALLFFGVSPK